MLFRFKSFRSVASVALAFFLASPLIAQSKDAQANLDNMLVHWKTNCAAKGCLMQTDVLRGNSEDPPDPKDFREYIGVDLALLRTTQKPAYIAFLVDPRAQQDQGIFVAFTKTVKDGNSWKVKLDSDGAMRLEITGCDQNACTARVPLGMIDAAKDGQKIDLLDKFLSSDHLLVLYVRDGHAYRTMVLLSSFKKEYGRVMKDELTKPAPTAPKE